MLSHHLIKLVGIKNQEAIEFILQSLWRSRKVGLDAAEKENIKNLLQLASIEELDPENVVLVCLRSLIRKCVHENLKEHEIQKIFPTQLPLDLQRLLLLMLLKLQSGWKEEMSKEQSLWPKMSLSYQVSDSSSLPPPPSSLHISSVPQVWSRIEDSRSHSNRREHGISMHLVSANRNSAQLVSQRSLQEERAGDNSLVSLPRLKAMTWNMENQNSTPAHRVAVINLKLQDYSKPSSGEIEIKFQLTKDSLEAILRSMIYIRDQLSNAVATQGGPVVKKARK